MSKDTIKTLPAHHESSLSPQNVIDLFKVTFDQELYRDDRQTLSDAIQSVKTELYNRNYAAAFDSTEKRTAYCCRWSPSRAIAYTSLFCHLDAVRDIVQSNTNSEILCIGGGAGGELVSIASIFAPSIDFNAKYSTNKTELQNKTLRVKLVDIADWTTEVQRLTEKLQETWLFDHAADLDIQSINKDVLKMAPEDLNLPSLNLITLLFTTNELFMAEKASSIRFFQRLNKDCASGCHLLIVESAGSYSHITVGTKKFPIQYLIDTLLLGKRGQESTGAWDLVQEHDSLWYRSKDEIDYPLKVENMRFFYRLYRKK
ncbi:LANO_0D10330g1_1 [Lachancea nothofagi CBS 11611]|uniref:LANO_0D10330g1_1 n=1 Tax=Lachancea nothofagi CBS 11611 TaxID=1266666 RepID=A0A1G4JK66_9SACH|nr:LANO_0D10330g1_1 [Lachancea nothofagi CBS 11611]